MSGAVVTFGEIMGRLDTLEYGKFVQDLPGNLRFTFGGAEANVAASVSQLGGGEARFVTTLPSNELGDACVRHLRGLGVDTRFIVRRQGRLGTYYVETGENQRPSKVIYDREHSAISLIEHTAFDWPAILSGASWLHITGITPALSRQSAENTLAICKLARQLARNTARNFSSPNSILGQNSLCISCDLNFRKKLWQWQPTISPRELARQIMPGLLEYVDVLIANEEDAADVLGIHARDTDINAGQISQQGYIQVAEQIVRCFPNISLVAITLRESVSASHNNWGAMLYCNGQSQFHKQNSPLTHFAPLGSEGNYAPYEIRNIVDRVGGGDAFAAGLIYAFNSGEYQAESALRFAVAASCLCHSIRGDFNYSTKQEVEQLMNGDGSGRVQR